MTIDVSDAIAGERSANSPVAVGAGALLVVIGVAGFFVAGTHPMVGPGGGQLFGALQVNMLHTVVHLGSGAALVAAAILGARQARLANTVTGTGYLLLCLFGVLFAGSPIDPLALNGADNALHLLLGVALVIAGLGADRGAS
jgi:hypothetical protein